MGPIVFFFNDTATTEIYTLSLHDALPISSSTLDVSTFRVGGSGKRYPISLRNAVYALMSNGLPLLARCQPSILACKVSRTANSSRILGARSRTMAASPAQNASGEIPVFGAASLAMKSNRTAAIFSPWASIRFIIKLSIRLSREAAVYTLFSGQKQRAPQR